MKEPYYLATDGMLARRDADPECDICKGWGLLDEGYNTGCVLTPCDCCVPTKETDE